ncbi:MAG TPA: CYTH domain-containing protein [Mucilaginibacter sp.]|jgi:adenylate cyclase|nr:CYTH domain-containing protein [Mucilaginibacter sp.]
MGLEIERKFLVDHKKWDQVEKPEGVHYRQGYMLRDGQQTIRVRISDTKGYLNLKSKISGLTRKEYEYEIPLQDGIEILNAFTTSGTEKIRYNIQFGGKLWEVDVFLSDNAGLIVAEIELKSESEEFEKPDWVTNEVTYDGRYTNASLSANPYKDWQV